MDTNIPYKKLLASSTCFLLLAALLSPFTVMAATADITLTFRPHCVQIAGGNGEQDWLFGPIPSGGMIANTQDGQQQNIACSSFEVQDPETLKTTPLREGDILDIDILAENPSSQPISRFRTWVSYDPNILEGELISVNSVFPQTVPDENDFFPEEGYAKIQASTESDLPSGTLIPVARIQFKVKKTTTFGTPIGFHDAQPEGHTFVHVKEGASETYALKSEPGVLLVIFRESESTGTPPAEEAPATEVLADATSETAVSDDFNPLQTIATGSSVSSAATSTKAKEGESCIQNQGCETGLCIAGVCAVGSSVENGGACTVDEQCASGLCGGGTCVSNIAPSTGNEGTNPQRTAFALLQIQNLRVTTEGSAVFLAWDHLRSSALQNYNVYYGTTSGKYIQRKTIAKEENTITIRSLPTGVQYYFAVRGVSAQGEESAFTREVSVTVGNPGSATMPLVRGTTELPVNPLSGNTTEGESMPGETGVSSIAVLMILASAIAGTLIVSRRQFLVSPPNIHE